MSEIRISACLAGSRRVAMLHFTQNMEQPISIVPVEGHEAKEAPVRTDSELRSLGHFVHETVSRDAEESRQESVEALLEKLTDQQKQHLIKIIRDIDLAREATANLKQRRSNASTTLERQLRMLRHSNNWKQGIEIMTGFSSDRASDSYKNFTAVRKFIMDNRSALLAGILSQLESEHYE